MLTASIDLILVVSAAAASFLAAFLAICVCNVFTRMRVKQPQPQFEPVETAMLFRGTDLIDATPRAEELLCTAVNGDTDFEKALSVLAPRFPDFEPALKTLETEHCVSVTSEDGAQVLTAEKVESCVSVTLRDLPGAESLPEIDPHALRAMTEELATLRASAQNVPFLIWRQATDGPVTWANKAYLNATAALKSGEPASVWPVPALFSADQLGEVAKADGTTRIALDGSSDDLPKWFDCAGSKLGDEVLFSAVNIDGTVLAEKKRRAFTQTLTKTFSHLTAGLAVFDKSRKLALFNPALTDLTTLPIDFLASKPKLYAFLDRLRDRQMIPEPKDYITWRSHMAELEAAARDGTYSETWSLPNGRTFQVTGRPHPDGAVAFIFEDISAEMTLTRRFRTELELGQSVIDSLDEAIAVFASHGEMILSNSAYTNLWSHKTNEGPEKLTVTEASRLWMARSAPTPIWGDLRDFVLHSRQREPWRAEVRLISGERLDCRVQPLAGGSTLVGFAQNPVLVLEQKAAFETA